MIAERVVRGLERTDRYRPFRQKVAGRRVGDLAALGAALAPVVGVGVVVAGFAIGRVDREQLAPALLAVAEVPGVFILAAVLWCRPLGQIAGRPFRRQRKWFGLSFAFCAVINLVGFLLEHPLGEMTRSFAIAGTIAVVCSLPLALTSTRGWIRRLGGRRWNRLHRLTYVIAAAVIVHLWIVPQDDGPGGNIVATIVFGLAAILRVRRVESSIAAQRAQRGGSLASLRLWIRPRIKRSTQLPPAT